MPTKKAEDPISEDEIIYLINNTLNEPQIPIKKSTNDALYYDHFEFDNVQTLAFKYYQLIQLPDVKMNPRLTWIISYLGIVLWNDFWLPWITIRAYQSDNETMYVEDIKDVIGQIKTYQTYLIHQHSLSPSNTHYYNFQNLDDLKWPIHDDIDYWEHVQNIIDTYEPIIPHDILDHPQPMSINLWNNINTHRIIYDKTKFNHKVNSFDAYITSMASELIMTDNEYMNYNQRLINTIINKTQIKIGKQLYAPLYQI